MTHRCQFLLDRPGTTAALCDKRDLHVSRVSNDGCGCAGGSVADLATANLTSGP